MNVPVDEQIAVITRGAVDVHVRAELEERLTERRRTGKPLRVKAGFDPTRPDLHIGHAVLMAKMRQFQDLGHQVILLVGEFTAMVGDPTGKNELRPRLTREEVQAAAKTYTDQAFKILDRSKTEIRSNSEWLDKMRPTRHRRAHGEDDRLAHARSARTSASATKKGGRSTSTSSSTRSSRPTTRSRSSRDIELGGTDQLFNLLVGRDLMPRYGQTAQMVLTTPLLEGPTPRSKTAASSARRCRRAPTTTSA